MTLNLNAVVEGLFFHRFDSAGAGISYFKDPTGFMIEKPACVQFYLCENRKTEELLRNL